VLPRRPLRGKTLSGALAAQHFPTTISPFRPNSLTYHSFSCRPAGSRIEHAARCLLAALPPTPTAAAAHDQPSKKVSMTMKKLRMLAPKEKPANMSNEDCVAELTRCTVFTADRQRCTKIQWQAATEHAKAASFAGYAVSQGYSGDEGFSMIPRRRLGAALTATRAVHIGFHRPACRRNSARAIHIREPSMVASSRW
jgi:hypothetical protein